ncbi:MAG: cation transporter [Candidatus Kapabacteria bacterium]|nr:cation transporter [Candidatus Kapabacteria bacterium]
MPLSIPLSARAQNRHAWTLALVTVAYNFAEGALALWLGHAAHSWGIVSFGLDAVAESFSGMVILWRFAPGLGWVESQRYARREQRAVVLVGISFLGLAVLIGVEALQRLLENVHAHAHGMAFLIAAVSLIVKPTLFWAKWRLGRRLRSIALCADAKQTLACAGLSAALLIGLVLQHWLGLWQADAVLAFLVAAVLVREGIHTLRHRHILCY